MLRNREEEKEEIYLNINGRPTLYIYYKDTRTLMKAKEQDKEEETTNEGN